MAAHSTGDAGPDPPTTAFAPVPVPGAQGGAEAVHEPPAVHREG